MRELRQEYEALDRRSDGLTAFQKEIGAFTALGGAGFRAAT
jgi:hypothetical protein